MPPSHPPRTFAASAVSSFAAALLSLSGCSGSVGTDSAPAPARASTSSAEVTWVPLPPTEAKATSTSAPTLPPEATADTREGAIAFVKHYIDLLNHAQSTGDVQALRPARTLDCETCITVEHALSKVYLRGGSITGGLWRLAYAVNSDFDPGENSWIIGADIRFNKQVVAVTRDASPIHNPSGRSFYEFTAHRSGESWRISRWSRAR